MFAVAALEVVAFLGSPLHLDCGPGSAVNVDWRYEDKDHVGHLISVNGRIRGSDGRFALDEQGLIINEVKTGDAGTYICGKGSSVYQKIRLNVSCE